MHQTLRGVFAEPKKPHRRNFLRENVLRIKNLQLAGGDTKKTKEPEDKKRNFVTTINPNRKYPAQSPTRSPSASRAFEKPRNNGLNVEVEVIRPTSSASTLRDQGIQTDCPDDEMFLKNAIIRYPSNLSCDLEEDCRAHHHHNPRLEEPLCSAIRKEPSFVSSAKSVSIRTPSEEGRQTPVEEVVFKRKPKQKVPESPEPVKRFVKGLIKTPPPDQKLDIPANYKMGEVPKYLKERKDELAKLRCPEPEDACCPEGHILLPEDDRLNTLEIAKKRFEALIKELNKLPMTSETLRVRQRKMEIEKELIKLEDNIRIFSRGRVYVKVTD